MRSIKFQNITKVKSGKAILKDLDLTIPSGEFFALLGPSGCGKTTLLRLIAGLETPDQGHLFLGEEEISQCPINERSINIVFQSYALFPHLSVFDNVAYSLSIQRKEKAETEEKVISLLRAFDLETHIFKYPEELSGGQQQRVALARAIISEPDVLLLDEPLAALDFNLREKMLLELIELQDKLLTTFVYVTHDQLEALTVADHMAIMNRYGEIEQISTPKEIYEFPSSSFVAKFVGRSNIWEGVLYSMDKKPYVDIPKLGHVEVLIKEKKEWMEEGSHIVLNIRPEKIFISKEPMKGFSHEERGVVFAIVYHGRSTQYDVDLPNGMRIQVFEQNEEHFAKEEIDYDDKVYLYWQKESVVLLSH